MDKIKSHADLLKEILGEYKNVVNKARNLKTQSVFVTDETSGIYAWFRFGWSEKGRISTTTFFARLRDDKIYIEEDWTENGIANDLIERGVSPKDIVLAFHPPEMRQYTDFATA
ncbi:MAG: XisI protein [Pyrinomonadaceae bacterium]|nr:XisI protein [Pyrinomonadaceae bacterium]